MPRLSSIHRIVLGLVSLSVSVLLIAGLLGFIPNLRPVEEQSRRSFSESAAVSFMALASRMDAEQLQTTLDRLRERNSEVRSIGVRESNGNLVLQSGPHTSLWKSKGAAVSSSEESIVPIAADNEAWGQLEIHWVPSSAITVLGFAVRSDLLLSLIVASASFVAFSLYLRKVLQHINPGKVVPNRVRDALNSLAEGLLVLDKKMSIVLANESFATATGEAAESMVGKQPGTFGFKLSDESGAPDFPWEITAQYSRPVKGVLLTRGDGDKQRTYSVSTVPVMDEKQQGRGVVVSFEDVTPLQKKQLELKNAVTSLKGSTEEIRKQNRELEWLATRDTLTGCLNRRSFFREFENHWAESHEKTLPLSAVMVDIDHFKSVNDNHGHSTGDEVLRQVARTLIECVGDIGLVCRYGGEEFTLLFPKMSMDETEVVAERIRLAIMALELEKLKVTASLGVSAICQHPQSPQDLLDQADQCLYVAKRNGRNQVVRWDRAKDDDGQNSEETQTARDEESNNTEQTTIPFHSVAALTSVLAHRDQAAAIHSRRVADMCVATAEGLLPMRECYVLELGALLHDIGKIGISEAILRKPGRLTAEEMETVRQYNRLGVEMVRGSFGSSLLTEIVEQNVVFFDMSNSERGAGPGHQPSISARILSIANAYDTMVSDLSYRNKMSRSEAFAELRSCAGTQFDPELVERFISAVRLRHHHREEQHGFVTKESALSIGLLLERFVAALDDQDTDHLLEIAASIQITSTTHGLQDIAKAARQLQDTLEEQHDVIDVMQIAGELLDLCRATQSKLLIAEHKAAAEAVSCS